MHPDMPQVCVDLFITTQAYVDMASISDIPRTTGGQVDIQIFFILSDYCIFVVNDLHFFSLMRGVNYIIQ